MSQLIDLGKIRFSYQGEYSNSTLYEVNDVVAYGSDSYVYFNTVSASGFVPTNASYWQKIASGLRWRGDWATSTSYLPNDVVTNNSSSYVTTTAHTSGGTFAGDLATYWNVLAIGSLPDQLSTEGYILQSLSGSAQWVNGGVNLTSASVVSASASSLVLYGNGLTLPTATTLVIPAGTTTTSPLRITTGGANLTSPVAGSIENDTDKLYFTSNATPGRGYIPSVYQVYASGNSTAATTTTPTSPFAAANDTISLEANKLYYFKALYLATITWTSGTPAIQTGFTLSNAQQAIKYRYRTYLQGNNTALTAQGLVSAATATTVSGTFAASALNVIELEGYFTSNASTGGTFLPFFQMSTTGASTVMTEFSNFKLEKLGAAGTTLIAGSWS
jgi:hypothetical protein